MTKEQKKRADELAAKIREVESRLKSLSDMLHPNFIQGDFMFSKPVSSKGILIDKRIARIIYTIIEADYKDELKKLEAEFDAL